MPPLPLDKQYIVCGCCCMTLTMFCSCEENMGLSMTNECACCMHECCYMERPPMTCFDKESGHIMRFGCCCEAITCKYPQACCRHICHSCCVVCSLSIPTSDDSPCLAACCFCICYPYWVHCYTLQELKELRELGKADAEEETSAEV